MGPGQVTAAPHPPLRRQPALLRRIFRDPQPVLDELRAGYGPVVTLGAGPVRMAIVGGPAEIRELFAMPNSSFRWNHKFNVLGFVVGQGSVIVADGEDHDRKRLAIQSAFSRRRLNGWIPMFARQVDEAVRRLPDQGTLDMYPVGRRLILEIVTRAFFGEQMGTRAVELGDLFQSAQDYIEAPAVRQLPHPFPFTARARVRRDRRRIDAIVNDEIARRRAYPTGDPNDVLEALVKDGELTDAEIRDQFVTLVGAGYDTTAASLAWMLWCVSLAPGLADRLRAEADEVLGHDAADLDHTHLARLALADRVVRETLRLHPAGVVSPRESAIDLEVGGVHVPKGTLILWSAHLAGRDAATWNDPRAFDPERFASMSDDQAAAAQAAWVPFGGGHRNCIGFMLAQMELTVIISRLAQQLDFAATSSAKPGPVGMVVNRPAGGVPMRITRRSPPGAT